MIGAALLSLCLGAEQWADEPVPPPEPVKVIAPRVGPMGGVHVGISVSTVAPDLGFRGGVRLRLGDHSAVSLYGDLHLVWIEPFPVSQGVFSPPPPEPLVLGKRLLGCARLEVISSSASPAILIPKLTAGLYFGVGSAFGGGQVAAPIFVGGLHLAFTRLEPSGWWFPMFLDLGHGGSVNGSTWMFSVGVGI